MYEMNFQPPLRHQFFSTNGAEIIMEFFFFHEMKPFFKVGGKKLKTSKQITI